LKTGGKLAIRQPEGFFPLIIGGDHAITAPAVRGLHGIHV